MNQRIVLLATLVLSGVVALQSCAGGPSPQAESPVDAPSEVQPTDTASAEEGTLQIRANGEDFVRQGFVSKDGWQINFDHVYVNLDRIAVSQTDPPYDPEVDSNVIPKLKDQRVLMGVRTVDLAAGDETAEPILVGEIPAPPGRYNALAWEMVKAPDGPAAGYPLLLQGTATKDGQTVNFTLKIDQELGFSCGDFVGDERKGILQAGQTADLEATFHFDHLFGDADTPADDALNVGALGFDPLAAIAQNNQLDADLATLAAQLSEEDYTKLMALLPSLGHVGEGHCEETMIQS